MSVEELLTSRTKNVTGNSVMENVDCRISTEVTSPMDGAGGRSF